MNLFHPTTAFAVIAVRAGCHHIGPDVLTAHMPRRNVIDRQAAFAFSTILAGIIVAAKYFPAGQLDMRARPMNLVLQPDDRRTGQQLFHRSNVSTPIHNHIRFPRQEQADGPPRGTNIDRLEVGIQHQYRLMHTASITGTIILLIFWNRKMPG